MYSSKTKTQNYSLNINHNYHLSVSFRSKIYGTAAVFNCIGLYTSNKVSNKVSHKHIWYYGTLLVLQN